MRKYCKKKINEMYKNYKLTLASSISLVVLLPVFELGLFNLFFASAVIEAIILIKYEKIKI
jgi:hypothetical protein